MTSPDFSQYIDLTDYDVQPQQLYQLAVEYARTALPEFNPRPGTLEDAILQAGALIGASTMGAVNRLPDELMEGILRVMGIERTEATSSTVEVEFELFTEGDTVLENTVYSFDYFNGVETISYPFVLNVPKTAGVGETTVTATLESLILGQIPSFSVGTQLIPQSPSSVVISVTTTSEVEQGRNSETETEFLNRAVTYLQSLSATLNTATQVENYILRTYADVKRVKAYDLVKATEHRISYGATVSSASGNGTTVTYTVDDTTGISVGSTVTISGVSPSAYNLSSVAVASVPNATTFTVTNAASGTYVSGGTVTLDYNSSHSTTTATVRTSSDFYAVADDVSATTFRIITPEFYGDASYSSTFPSGTFTTTEDSLAIASNGTITYTDVVSNTDSSGPLIDAVILDTLQLSYVSNNEQAGYFAVFVCGEDGAPIGRSLRKTIEEDVANRVPAGLIFNILDAWVYDISVILTIGISAGFSATTVSDAVKQTVEALVSPNEWPNFEQTVRIYEIVAAASGVNGVAFVSSVESDVPEYPDVAKGNEFLVEQLTSGTQVTGYSALYAGLLPRVSVEVVSL